MNRTTICRILTYGIATVWIANGLFCKVLDLVPRHEQIVARILGSQYAGVLTKAIGIAEILMAVWILIGITPRFNAVTQIVVVGAMNILEFFLAPDLLLWGRFNSVFASLFMILVGYNEFVLQPRQDRNRVLSFLKNHPFAVEGFFQRSLVLTFAAAKEELQPLIPECLALDTFADRWAFVAVAMVQTTGLRPSGFPKLLGSDFFLIGYRVFVRYTNRAGRRLRGLYILKSETDSRRMEFFGNIFTRYQYTTTDIRQAQHDHDYEVRSERSDFRVAVRTQGEYVPLPEHSPFADWQEARKFAGPMPYTITYNREKREVLIIEGVRERWMPRPVQVIDYHISFLQTLPLTSPVLANAFVVEDIPYHWKKGRTEPWGR
jgi:hypothetical protein